MHPQVIHIFFELYFGVYRSAKINCMEIKNNKLSSNLRTQTRAESVRVSLLPGINVTEIGAGKVHIGYEFDRHAFCISNLKKNEVNYIKTLVPCDQRRALQEKYGESVDSARKQKLHEILAHTNLLQTQTEYAIVDKSASGTSILPQLNACFGEDETMRMLQSLDNAIVGVNKLDRLGAVVAYRLAANRIGKIVVGVDKGATVAVEDIGEVFTSKDVGLPKLDIFKRFLKDRNLDTVITRYCGAELSFCILNCAFTHIGTTAISLMTRGVPHLFALVNQVSVEISNITVPGKSACINCFTLERQRINTSYQNAINSYVTCGNNTAKLPSDVSLINNAAGLIAKKAVQHILGICSEEEYIRTDIVKPMNLDTDHIATRINAECGCCGML
jgi:NADH/NAD ratio-sensing transcriptional regulator Rex